LRKLLLRVWLCRDASVFLLGSDLAIVADFSHPLPRPQFREISVKFLH
jgi:hypothetical protein